MADPISSHPVLSKLWDHEKNGSPSKVGIEDRYRPVWWRCANGHSFQRALRLMERSPECPQCKVQGASSSVAKQSPGLVPLWHPEKNGEQLPTTVDATQTASYWWRCPKGHDFQRSPLLMLRDANCPSCAVAEKSLQKVSPAVASEWHPVRNGDLTPSQIEADHMMNVWWVCSKGHEYQATVRARVKSGRSCPTCHGGWSLDNLRQFVKSLLGHIGALNPSELYALAMQAGVLNHRA